MNVGIFSTIQCPPGRENETPLRFLRRIEAAEQAGFDSVWLAERHFTGYGVIGNPVVFAGAVAARTTRLKIGFAALILAQHNPVELAEQLVMLDTLSEGRIIIGVGTGRSPVEFGALGIDVETRQARFDEAMDLISNVWANQPFEHHGAMFSSKFPGLRMGPIQHRPPFIRAIVHEDSIIASAKRGIPVLMGRFEPETLAANVEIYVRTLRECGRSEDEIAGLMAQSGFLRHIVVGETRAEAEALARNGIAGYIDRANEVLEPHELESFLPRSCAYGTADDVVAQIEPYAALGFGRILCWFDFGGMDPDAADANLARFNEQVLPRLLAMPASFGARSR